MLHSSVFHAPRFIRSLLCTRANRFFLTLTSTALLVAGLLMFTSAIASPVPNADLEQVTAQPQTALPTQAGSMPEAIPAALAVNEAATPNFTPEYFGGAKSNASIVAVGDVNGDGSLDIVTNYAVYLNDEHGGFGTEVPYTTTNGAHIVAVGDMNGDGMLDIISGSTVYLNDGHGGFNIVVPFGGSYPTSSIAVGDVNGDGGLDIVQSNIGVKSMVYLNDGHGIFGVGIPFGAVIGAMNTTVIALGDVNGDSAPDIIQGVGCPSSSHDCMRSLVYLNDGRGNFGPGVPFGTARNTTSIALGDVNGDGPLDIVSGNGCIDYEATCVPSVVYLNAGAGGFITGTILSVIGTNSMALSDVNGDGALDVINGSQCYFRSGHQLPVCLPSMMYLNDGNGNFNTGIQMCAPTCFANVASGDVNGDGALDIIGVNRDTQNVVYVNNGPTGFGLGGAFGTDSYSNVNIGDLNRDGFLDVLRGCYVYLNDGHGRLGTKLQIPCYGNIVGDMNGDGALDIIQMNTYTQSIVYLNDGHGGFGTGVPFGAANNTYSIVLGDVNGDGALDIVQGNNGQQSMVYLNNGYGAFGTGVPFGAANNTYSIVLGDVNGDGALDIVQGNNGQQSMVYLNNGYGAFGTEVPFGYANNTYSIALGDVNGDGALDIVQGNSYQQSIVYFNTGLGSFDAKISFGGADDTRAIALGDMNGDGTLDIALGNVGEQSAVYLNDGHATFSERLPLGVAHNTTHIVVGDMDSDGALDIIQGNALIPQGIYPPLPDAGFIYYNRLFDRAGLPNNPLLVGSIRPGRTNNAALFSASDILGNTIIPITCTLFDSEGDTLRTIHAYYSLDGGGRWLPAVAASNTITTNLPTFGTGLSFDGINDYVSVLTPTVPITNFAYTLAVWIKPDMMGAKGIVGWGNYGATNQVNALRLTDNGLVNYWWGNDLTVVTGPLTGTWHHVAATYNGITRTIYLDGVPIGSDKPVGHNVPNGHNFRIGSTYTAEYFDGAIDEMRIYNRALSTAEIRDSMLQVVDSTAPGLVGYWRFDEGRGTVVHDQTDYHNDGILFDSPAWIRGRVQAPVPYIYNWDTFASGFFGQSDNVVFRIEVYPSLTSDPNGVPVFQHPYASATTFPFRVRGTQVRVISGTQPISKAIVYDLPVDQTVGATIFADNAGKPFYTDGQGYLLGRGQMGIGDRLIALYPVYSQYRDGSLTFDGINNYVGALSPTVPISNSNYTLTAWIKPVSMGSRGIVGWGNYSATNQINALRLTASGLANSWGNNDLAANTGPLTGTWHYVVATFNGMTRTLYLDGVIVGSDTPTGHAVPDSGNFQIGSTNGGEYFAGEIGEISVWNVARSQTELQADMVQALSGNEVGLVGHWRFDEGSGSIAHDQTSNHNDGTLSGPTWNGGGEQYTVYHTSAAPNDTGLSMATVLTPGVQTLVVTSSNSLILFNLDVALEWDARQDTQFLSQLDHDLQRTSELLFDWSNGQAALGTVNVYFDRENWDAADVQIHATNRLRPNATQGGIVPDLLADPITVTGIITYGAGQVNMGAVWNRYGEASGNLGEDWPRALAHELGHYALFLDDDYLGLDANNHLIPIDTCSGTVMSDPYREDYSEFHPGGSSWISGCANTLAAKQTGRWDWQTITTFYPWLKSTANTGPSGLPLDVTTINFVKPVTPTTVLLAPIFNLTQDGARVQPGTSARAYLYQQTDRLIDLGGPTLDQVNARGARVGDRLCVYDLSAQRLGCETITAGDEELALVAKPAWQPDILVTPVNSHTFNLSVNVAGLTPAVTMRARLYPIDGAAPAAIALLPSAGSGYSGTFTLDEPAPQGYVQVWVDEPDPRRESIVDYALGGNPAYRHGTGAYRHGTGAYRHGTGAYRHGTGAYRHGTGAPTESPDGQVVIFADGLVFAPGEFFALQAVNTLPSPPAGATRVGQAYRLMRSTNAPSLIGASISFYYAGRDVLPGEEDFLRVVFWDGSAWQLLPTVVDTDHNIAIATIPSAAQGAGIYALMSSIEIPLYGPGWNQFGYPAQGSKPVAQALLSISGYYTTVYGAVITDTADPWKVYDVTAPDWVNDLATLDFGKTYWINVSQAIVLKVTGGGMQRPASAETLPSPPMTVYGPVVSGGGFTAAAGQTVMAWIDGVSCGQGTTRLIDGLVVYTLNIQPDAPGGKIGCGAPGRSATFTIDGQPINPRVMWNDDAVWNVPLRRGYEVYLPLIRKG